MKRARPKQHVRRISKKKRVVVNPGVKKRRRLKPARDNSEKLTAAKRFGFDNVKRMEKVGQGRDRVVVDRGDGTVIKFAKTKRGLVQNDSELDFMAGILPEGSHVKILEAGKDYLVEEKADKADKRVTEFLRPLKKFDNRDFRNKSSDLQEELREKGLQDYMNWDLNWGDFTSKRNWGIKEGKPVFLDGGSLNEISLGLPAPSEYDDSWNDILYERKKSKRKRR